MGKEICHDSNIKIDKDQPSTSKVFNPDYVTVKDSQNDSDDDEKSFKRNN